MGSISHEFENKTFSYDRCTKLLVDVRDVEERYANKITAFSETIIVRWPLYL